MALTHHEHWGGGGYPSGLRGEEIPLEGRIAAVCDVYDAVISPRPYKDAWTVDAACAEIASGRGGHFDPAVADALLAVIARRQPSAAGFVAGVDSTEDHASPAGAPAPATVSART